ncbi:hypothetical protein SBV1_1650015 [Verrucomicrobia bacterium]|nr:hypothetical protein SBV1_1650015 [Verrucomicrobiota bacterium]
MSGPLRPAFLRDPLMFVLLRFIAFNVTLFMLVMPQGTGGGYHARTGPLRSARLIRPSLRQIVVALSVSWPLARSWPCCRVVS